MNVARNRAPWSPATAVTVYVLLVAPAMSVKSPPGAARCHCTVGVAFPVAAAVNDASAPTWTSLDVGDAVTTGATPWVMTTLRK